MHGSALTFGNREISRRAWAWTLRLALTLTVGLVFTVWSSEEAHAVSNVDYFPFGSSFCVGERSSTYESSSGFLYGQSVTRPLTYDYYYGPCSFAVTKRAGDIAGRVSVYKWSDRSEDWLPCRKSGWLYNSSRTSALLVYAPLGYPGNRWCGRGWYGTWSQGSVWKNNAWKTTGWVWSGYDYYQ
jgi:hypothetical protein